MAAFPLAAFPWPYSFLVAAVGAERLVELRLSRRNRRAALARGGFEAGRGHYPAMVALHTGLLVACLGEVWWCERPWIPELGFAMLALLALSMTLRYWAITTLGERWNTRIVVIPGVAPVVHGPYRLMRHPNYLAVVLELVALPLVHSAWLTAIVFSLLNAWLLGVRVRAEEAALRSASPYDASFADRRGFAPRGAR